MLTLKSFDYKYVCTNVAFCKTYPIQEQHTLIELNYFDYVLKKKKHIAGM